MKDFLKSNILGGIVFLVPILVIVLLLQEAMDIMIIVTDPLDELVPVDTIGGFAVANMIAVISLLLVCLLAGLAAKSVYFKRINKSIDSKLKILLPGYALIRGLASGIHKDDADDHMSAVIARFKDSSQIGVEVERLENGLVVVYLPGSPNPWSGRIVYMTEDRIEKLDVEFSTMAQVMESIGIGSGEKIFNSKIKQS